MGAIDREPATSKHLKTSYWIDAAVLLSLLLAVTTPRVAYLSESGSRVESSEGETSQAQILEC